MTPGPTAENVQSTQWLVGRLIFTLWCVDELLKFKVAVVLQPQVAKNK